MDKKRCTEIYNFLKYQHLLNPLRTPIDMEKCAEEGIFPHYSIKQMELFGDIKTNKKEMHDLECMGLVKHYTFKDYDDCYYAV